MSENLVKSVNGKQGFVNLTTSDIPEDNSHLYLQPQERITIKTLLSQTRDLREHTYDDSIHVTKTIFGHIESNTAHRHDRVVHLTKAQKKKYDDHLKEPHGVGPRGRRGYPGPPGPPANASGGFFKHEQLTDMPSAINPDHDGRYFNKTESDGRYVNITGDTMTGDLTIDNSGSATATLTLDGTSSAPLTIRYESDNELLILDRAVAMTKGLTVNTTDLVVDAVNHRVGINTAAPDVPLEINAVNGGAIRLTYNDADGSATTHADLIVESDGDLFVSSTKDIAFGAPGGDVFFGLSTVPQVRFNMSTGLAQSVWAVADTIGNQMVFANFTTAFEDFDHDTQTDPTFYFHSDLDPMVSNSQWGSLHHDQEDFIIETGVATGAGSAPTTNRNAIVLKGTGGVVTTAGRIKNTTRYTTTQAIPVTDDVVFANTDGSAWTATLPIGAEGQTLKIVNSGSSGNLLTLAPNGAEHLLGVNSNFLLFDGESLIVTYNATDGWY